MKRKRPIVVVLKTPECFGIEKQSEKCNNCVHCFDCIERRSEKKSLNVLKERGVEV